MPNGVNPDRLYSDSRTEINLEDIQFKTECSVPWDDMSGDDTSRFCGKCDKQVFNITAMSREEAEKLMMDSAGEACIGLHKRPDGTVTTADCKPVVLPHPPDMHTTGRPGGMI